MAGMGKRMRPHTLTIPKPLIKIAGKPIVQLLIEEIGQSLNEKITDIAFVIGDFGEEVEENLKKIAIEKGAKPEIFHQHEALGTGHAIYCAEKFLKGNVIVAFADTLFKANINIDKKSDCIIWVKDVKDPSQFGVVRLNKNKEIVGFVEKPTEFISNLAIVGIYYFKEGEKLKAEIQNIIDNNIKVSNEYQLTTALENLVIKGSLMKPCKIDIWLDCGNKNATVNTNKEILKLNKIKSSKNRKITNSVIIEPSFLGKNVEIENSIIGPYVSVGSNSQIKNSIVSNSIIQSNTIIEFENLKESMIGNNSSIIGKSTEYNIGDYCNLNLK